MGLTNLASRVVVNSQKRNFAQLRSEVGASVAGSVHRQIYYPESSEIIRRVTAGMASGLWKKKSCAGSVERFDADSMRILRDISGRADRLLCFFPGFSPRSTDVVSDLPVLEIGAGFSVDWYKVAKKKALDFYFCSSVNFDAGMIVHKTSGPITDLYSWGD
jgi:hypothetical protein